MILDPTKTVVIYNTADTSGGSQSVAEYYAAARNLGHVLGVDLGLTYVIPYASMPAFRVGALTTIRDYLDANAIEGVVLSINCPKMAQARPYTDWTDISSLCKIIGNCWDVIATADTQPKNTLYRGIWRMTALDGSYDAAYQSFNVYESALSYDYNVAAPVSPRRIDWRQSPHYGGTKTIPCGRLGLPTGTFADDATLALRCIDDAVWYERNGDPGASTMLFGLSSRGADPATYAPLTVGNVAFAHHVLASLVCGVEVYDGNYAGVAGTKYAAHNWQFAQPTITIPDAVTFLAGSGPVKSVWGWLGTGAENTGTAFTGSVQFERGGWMFESTSTDVSKHALSVGACACICPVTEPGVSGLPEIGGLSRQLARGMSMMEAELCSGAPQFVQVSGLYAEAWGDPLYTPFSGSRRGRSAIPMMGASME